MVLMGDYFKTLIRSMVNLIIIISFIMIIIITCSNNNSFNNALHNNNDTRNVVILIICSIIIKHMHQIETPINPSEKLMWSSPQSKCVVWCRWTSCLDCNIGGSVWWWHIIMLCDNNLIDGSYFCNLWFDR